MTEPYPFDPQDLIDTGMAWKLEGSVGRQCMALIENGQVRLGWQPHRTFYGNLIPAWWMIEPGNIGRPAWCEELEEPSEERQAELLADVGLEAPA